LYYIKKWFWWNENW